jgi:hypothetical protein
MYQAKKGHRSRGRDRMVVGFTILLRRGVLDTTLSDKVCQKLAAGRWFSPGTPIFYTNKTDRYPLTQARQVDERVRTIFSFLDCTKRGLLFGGKYHTVGIVP